MNITTLVEVRHRSERSTLVRYDRSFASRMLYTPRSSNARAAEWELASELRFQCHERSATGWLLTVLAGEMGLALDSWGLKTSAFAHLGGRVSGLAFHSGSDHTMTRSAIGPTIAPYTDQECLSVSSFLPQQLQHKVVNRDHMIGMDIFDSWCGPGSRHETVFIETADEYRAVFFPFRTDWRLGFDLPGQHDPPRYMHWHPRQKLQDPWVEQQIAYWGEQLVKLSPSLVKNVLDDLPSQWNPPHWERLVLRWIEDCDVERAVAKLKRNLDLYLTGPRPFRRSLDGKTYTL